MVITADEQPFHGHLAIEIGTFFEFETGLPVPEGHGDGGPVGVEVGRVARIRIAQQVHHRVLLPLRPQALASHETARGGQHVDAGQTEQCERQHHGQERPDDAQNMLIGREGGTALLHRDIPRRRAALTQWTNEAMATPGCGVPSAFSMTGNGAVSNSDWLIGP
ncbi:hypothetical protein D3C87_1336590 [compost metagenome]